MDETTHDTEGMQGDGVRDDAARTTDALAKAGEPTSRTSEDAMGGANDERDERGDRAAGARDEPHAD